MIDFKSIYGYQKGSPFFDNPYLDIQSNVIDMSNTPIDLIGIDNLGNKKMMKAGRKNPYRFAGNIVREIPMQYAKIGGEVSGDPNKPYHPTKNPDGYKGLKPIYTSDPNDKRLKDYKQAYQANLDSSLIHQNYLDVKKALEDKNYDETSPIRTIKRLYSDWDFSKKKTFERPNTTGLKKESDSMYSVDDFIPSTVNKNLPRQFFSNTINPEGTQIYYKGSVYGKNVFHPVKDTKNKANYIDKLEQDDNNWFTSKPDYRVVANYENVKPKLKPEDIQPVIYQKPQQAPVKKGSPTMWTNDYDKKYPPIYVTDPKDPRIGMYDEAGNRYLYRKPPTPQRVPLNVKGRVEGNPYTVGDPNLYQPIGVPNIDVPINPTSPYSITYPIPGYNQQRSEYFLNDEDLKAEYLRNYKPVSYEKRTNGTTATGYKKEYQGGGNLMQRFNRNPSDNPYPSPQAPIADKSRYWGYHNLNPQTIGPTSTKVLSEDQKWANEQRRPVIDPAMRDYNIMKDLPQVNKIGQIPEDLFMIASTIMPAGKLAGKLAKNVGNYLVENTALKNASKINPFAFKPNPEAYYRMLGEKGMDDAIEKGILKTPSGSRHGENVWFSKGFPKDSKWQSYATAEMNKGKTVSGWAGYDGPYIAEASPKVSNNFVSVADLEPTAHNLKFNTAKGIVNPNNPFKYNDPNIKFYKQDWLQGYKKVRKPLSEFPVQPTGKGSSIQTLNSKQVNYWEEPKFKERNPDYNHEAAMNTAGNTNPPTKLNPNMTPQEKMDWKKINEEIKRKRFGDNNNPYQKGGLTAQQIFQFLRYFKFDDKDEEENVPTAPSTEDVQPEEKGDEDTQRDEIIRKAKEEQYQEDLALWVAMGEETGNPYMDNMDNMSMSMSMPAGNQYASSVGSVDRSSSWPGNPYRSTSSSNADGKIAYIANALKQDGYTKEQTAGVLANIIQETGNLRDDVIALQKTGDNHLKNPSYGLIQWREDRYDGPNGLLAFAKQNNINPGTIPAQTAFLIAELNQTGNAKRVKAEKTAIGAMKTFNFFHEISADSRNKPLYRAKHLTNNLMNIINNVYGTKP